MLKRIWQKIILEQKGQMLPLVLVLMLLSGLLIVPTLNYASNSIKAKQVTEKKTLELYAADAGVEEALSYLSQFAKHWDDTPPGPPDIPPYEYIKPPKGEYYQRETTPHADELVINGKTVELVRVEREESEGPPYYYKITSTANSTGTDEGSTTVTSYVEFLDFSCLWEDYLVTSKSGIKGVGADGIPPGEKKSDYDGPWPRADDLEKYYRRKVPDEGHDPGLDVNATTTIPEGGLYSDAEEFLIEGVDNNPDNKLTLNATNGTVYIKGNLQLGSASGHFFTLDLNGQTIFVEGEIKTGTLNAFAVNGTGCIIAVGLIEFAPGIEFNSGEFVFIMSVDSTVLIQPNADFNGAIAGGAITGADTVWLKSGDGSYSHDLPPDLNLNFPQDTDAPITILSWQIS